MNNQRSRQSGQAIAEFILVLMLVIAGAVTVVSQSGSGAVVCSSDVTSFSGSIPAAGESHYEVQIHSGQTITIHVPATSELAPEITLVARGDSIVGFEDEGGSGARLVRPISQSDTYTIIITDSGDRAADFTGTFSCS